MTHKILFKGPDTVKYNDFKVQISKSSFKAFSLLKEVGTTAKKACYRPSLKLFTMNSEIILNALYKERQKNCSWSMSGTYLGGMELYSGYTRADMGPWEHPVTSLDFHLSVKPEGLNFSVNGNFGDVLIWRDLGMHGYAEYKKRFESFIIEFEIEYADLQNIFKDKDEAARVEGYCLNYILNERQKEKLSKQP